MEGSIVIMEVSIFSRYFFTPMDGSHVIMEGSLLSIFFLLQWMVALLLWKVVCCRDFGYYNGWQSCHYGRYSIVDIFVTQWMVALSLWKVVCCRDFFYSNGW